MNTLGNIGGLIGPLVVGIAVDRWHSWTFPFYITSLVYAGGALAWLAIDPTLQSWDRIVPEADTCAIRWCTTTARNCGHSTTSRHAAAGTIFGIEPLMRQDLRGRCAVARRSRPSRAVAVLTLALGIGANTAIFSGVTALLVRPLPVADADRVVRAWRCAKDSIRSARRCSNDLVIAMPAARSPA